eukprot:m.426201 g.426201  ORF g.426201 m.426201 type:complete len:497 (+) comp21353_c0_seq5:613-2103(+)
MSVITIQVGQAGNQIGQEFLDLVSRDALSGEDLATVDQHFRSAPRSRTHLAKDNSEYAGEQYIARAVLVDMESKAVSKVMRAAKQSCRWSYNTEGVYAGTRGAGNNWARGYVDDGKKAVPKILDMVRREAELCDTVAGFVLPMSVAGGTGSGVGTLLTQQLRDEYPRDTIMNQVVWPFSAGEVIVQNYNAMLSLSRVYRASDAVVLFENDSMNEICARIGCMSGRSRGIAKVNVSLDAINSEIARHMAGMLSSARAVETSSPQQLPPSSDVAGRHLDGNAGSATEGSFRWLKRPTGLREIAGSLCSHPDYKLLTVRCLPQMPDAHKAFSNYTWPRLVKTLRQMQVAVWPCEEGVNWQAKPRPVGHDVHHPEGGAALSDANNRAISNLLVLRGRDSNKYNADIVTQFNDATLYTRWYPQPLKMWVSPHTLDQHPMTATLVSNSRCMWKPLDHVTKKAWRMYQSRAFLHQYTSYGIGEDEFIDSFVQMEQVIKNYKSL